MIKKGDFIEIDYTGKLKDENIVFDTTSKDIAKKEGIENAKMAYKPVVICVGENHVIKGLDEDLVGKETGKEYSISINAENAFGKKDAKYIQLISLSKFRKQNINPVVGMQVEIDGSTGTVKTATGGRVMVDFNHPLSGKDVVYEYKINRIVEDEVEKIKAYFNMLFGVDVIVDKTEKGYDIKSKSEMPDELKKKFEDKLKEIISDKHTYTFSVEEKAKNIKE